MIQYDLGEDFNFTTPTPETTTPKLPDAENGIKIFVLPVNEQSFCETQFEILIEHLETISETERCKLLHTPPLSCRNECQMSDDPDRGCVKVIVGLIYDPLICKMTQEDFQQKIEDQVDVNIQ